MSARRRKASIAPPTTAPPRRPRSAAVAWLALGIVAGFGSLWAVVGHGRRSALRPSVLLVTIDTLRADRVGCYGYGGAATPVVDGLAARGVRFATAVAHAPLTAPSHASILTGLTPLRHGVRDNGTFVLPETVPTLAEAFQKAGYRTAAFVSGFPLDRRFGLVRGFDTYDDRLPHGRDPRRAPYVERTADATTRVAVEWLRATSGPWFAWVHYFDPHAPYEPPSELAARFEGRPYDGEIAFVDEELGKLLRGAGSDGPDTRLLVLVTADHGESLGEHGEDTHGVFIYDATLRIPWIVAGPGVPKGVSPVVARGVDVAPTLLDYAGLPALAGAQGRSLRRAAAGEPLPDEPAYVESLFARLNLGWAELRGWRTQKWKLVEAPRPELYAVDVDAGETHDLAQERREVVESLRRPLLELLSVKTPDAPLTHSGETAERLRALGYLGGSAPAVPTLRDPKDGVGLLHRLERGLAEARANPALALAELTAVLQQEPGLPLALRYRAIAHQVAGRYDAAAADLGALERQGPLSLEDLVLLAETQRLAGRPEPALAALDRVSKQQDPRAPEPMLIRARVLRSMGRGADARPVYERVLSALPSQIEALRGLAELDFEQGALASAEARLEAILRIDAEDVGALVRLGVVRVRTGRPEEGLSLFERAVSLAPRDPEALLDLAGALAKVGRTTEAVPYFERAIEAGGPTTVALNGLGFARLESGDATGALKALRQSLALQPGQPQVSDAVTRLAGGRRP